MGTIKEIARRAGVSPTTVSNVLHGNTGKVSPDTLARVQAIIQAVNYAPNMGAIILARKKSRIIGVIMFMEPRRNETVLEDPFSSTIMGAMEAEIRKRGYFMMIHTTSDEDEVVRLAKTWKLAGLVLVWVPSATASIIRRTIDTPVVFVDSYFDRDGQEYHSVGLNDAEGGYLMARYLLSQGHHEIAFIANDAMRDGADRARFEGCRKAFIESGKFLDEQRYFVASKDPAERRDFYRRLGSYPLPYSALVFSADYYAAEALSCLQDYGVAIPGDISITGFDDNIFARIVRPRLTTIRQDVYGKGQAAVSMLMSLMHREPVVEHDLRLAVELVIGDSVRPLGSLSVLRQADTP
ncbi:MAG TPA: LacI family transcriptional regulator [Spirochaetaceae bacterium]|jgi:LacI family transcriptional regulator|nr:LacI family transcriptional regulator [Spirochaetaceae bacterium]